MKSGRIIVALSAIVAVILVAHALLKMQWSWKQEATYSALKGHSIALHQYHDEHGTLPPAVWTNEFGVTFSYRILLMKYMDSAAARQVARDAQRVKSVEELEATAAFQRWSKDDYVRGLLANLNYVPVEGPWPTWGHSLRDSQGDEWNENRVPMVVGIRQKCDSWCTPSPPIKVDGSAFQPGAYDWTDSIYYISCDGGVYGIVQEQSP